MEVLYRKYRPKKFSEIVGQDHVKKILSKAIEEGRVSHAYIFAGPRGTGKTTTARILAKALNCERREGYEPCGECHACRSIDEGTFMDVVELDAASNRGIDEIRRIRDSASYRPIEGKFRVYIIDEFHMLTREAFNALLKTLEEPPEHVVFILATTDLEKVPPTIVSRCQVLEFRNLPDDLIVERLKKVCEMEGIEITDEALGLIAKRAEGSMRDALTILEQVWRFAGGKIGVEDVEDALGLLRSDIVDRFVNSLVSRNLKDALEVLDEVFYSGKDFEVLYKEAIDELVRRISKGDVKLSNLVRELLSGLKEMRFFENRRLYALAHISSLIGSGKVEKEEIKEGEAGVDKNLKEDAEKSDEGESRKVSPILKTVMEHLKESGDLSVYVSLALADSIEDDGENLIVVHSKDKSFHHEILKQNVVELENLIISLTGEKRNVVLKLEGETEREKEITGKLISLFGGNAIKEEG